MIQSLLVTNVCVIFSTKLPKHSQNWGLVSGPWNSVCLKFACTEKSLENTKITEQPIIVTFGINKYLQWVIVSWTICVIVFCSKIFADRDGQLVFKCTFRQCRNPSLPAGSWNTAEDLFYFQFPSVLLQLLYSHLFSCAVALRQIKRNTFAFFFTLCLRLLL